MTDNPSSLGNYVTADSCVRHRPASGSPAGSISGRCIASTDSADTVELTASAASIARTFPLTIDALRLLGEPNSASASDRAPTVRFSICDEAALFDRSRIELIGSNSVGEPSRAVERRTRRNERSRARRLRIQPIIHRVGEVRDCRFEEELPPGRSPRATCAGSWTRRQPSIAMAGPHTRRRPGRNSDRWPSVGHTNL